MIDEKWKLAGACNEVGTEPFFPERGEPITDAVAVCRACPVLDRCREYSLAHTELEGIWAGLTRKQRSRLRVAMGMSYRDRVNPTHERIAVALRRGESVRDVAEANEVSDGTVYRVAHERGIETPGKEHGYRGARAASPLALPGCQTCGNLHRQVVRAKADVRNLAKKASRAVTHEKEAHLVALLETAKENLARQEAIADAHEYECEVTAA